MRTPAPPVILWYRVYAGLMALLYLAVVAAGVLVPLLAELQPDDPPRWLFLLAFGCVGLPLLVAYVAALFLPPRPWVWVYHLVLIAIGLTSPCCLPACVPLLIFWIKPDVQRYFGRD